MLAKILNESKNKAVYRKLAGNESLLKFIENQYFYEIPRFSSRLTNGDFENKSLVYFSKLTDGKQGLWFQPTEDSLVMLISERNFNKFRNTIYFFKKRITEEFEETGDWKLYDEISTISHSVGTEESKFCSRIARNFMYKISKISDKVDIYYAMISERRSKRGWL